MPLPLAVIVRTQDLLILSDVEFLSTVTNYFRATFDPKAVQQKQQAGKGEELEDTVKASSSSSLPAVKDTPTTGAGEEKAAESAVAAQKPLPKLKCQLTISNFRVAIIEDVYTENPQAISLNVCVRMA